MQNIHIGDLCKHFKGKTLLEKNIYKILLLNVIYSGDNATKKLDDLVVYQNIFDGKIFTREASDIFATLSEEKQIEFNQTYKVQKLDANEIEEVNTSHFKAKKKEYIKNKWIFAIGINYKLIFF